MTMAPSPFLPGVPEGLVRAALGKAGGNELESGKFESPESSAALAVNAFGWFIQRPSELPPFPGLSEIDWPAKSVEIERQMRFPWQGGRHPWLDAAVETQSCLIGVESKRFEPFRDTKSVSLSSAYDRDVWGEGMTAFEKMRDDLRSGAHDFVHLDAAQLVKHAFGLVSEGRRLGKEPMLLYLYAEPSHRGSIRISSDAIAKHRIEVSLFADAIRGAKVCFASCAYHEWLAGWRGDAEGHAKALKAHFGI